MAIQGCTFGVMGHTIRRGRRRSDVSAEALRLRDNVLSIVAHDLRSPLATIIMAADLISQRGLDAQNQHFLELIEKAARQADVLIKDLTDVNRLEVGKLSLHLSSEPLAYLLDSVIEPIAENAGLLLACNTADVRSLEIRVDQSRFVQILSNLISNAIKFTAPGGHVLVTATRLKNVAKISVTDSGMGVSAEELPHVFERFWQADHHHRAGAGLGLAIVKGLVEAHGGTVGVVSTKDVGSTFYFTIPLSDATQNHT
jgi:signal transduction histidine kinase